MARTARPCGVGTAPGQYGADRISKGPTLEFGRKAWQTLSVLFAAYLSQAMQSSGVQSMRQVDLTMACGCHVICSKECTSG